MAKLINKDVVCDILHISQSTAYKVIKQLNEELKDKGYMTISGRVPEEYLRERYNLKNESYN
ncbi:M trans-acting positive regulator [Peptoniphilus asaccharolyticus DSM 20463]|uniref:M trans-acting positive regulator n=1 Tax=Peptoniphilus asaccharolyticus DSM 20463 TaxID=573058 RepID=A0A1W1VA07_PEPAS|nr:hypothetical protein [Peptoniphilus asaccharolyticus]MBL7575761.1 LysR family transcriptional regulator [Peptoniphilus asaccharolyticus]SMB90096.1 M trans-acting positive regulator [Peptoniphilus asaccharolyticus DSM 20463]